MVIWKYILENPEQEIVMPRHARILTVQMQNSQVCLWARVDSDKAYPREVRQFKLYGTGHTIPSISQKYIGTVQFQGMGWHLFEKFKENDQA